MSPVSHVRTSAVLLSGLFVLAGVCPCLAALSGFNTAPAHHCDSESSVPEQGPQSEACSAACTRVEAVESKHERPAGSFSAECSPADQAGATVVTCPAEYSLVAGREVRDPAPPMYILHSVLTL